MNSFLGFGVFKIARESGFLPGSMFTIFETLMYEETRHIVFFVSWMAYDQVRRGHRAAWRRGATALRFYARAVRRMVGTARRGAHANEGRDFTATQANLFLEGFTFRRFVADCYAENARRMGEFDPDLLRPIFLPQLADIALSGLRLWSRRRASVNRPVIKAALLVALIGGLVFGTILIGYFGFAPVAKALFAVGWGGFGAVVACHLAILAWLGFCWYLLAPRGAALVTFVWGRLIRDSSAEVLPLSQLGGFAMGARATMLLGLPAALALATTVMDVTQELIGQLAYTALGLGILRWRDPGQDLLGWAAAGLAVGCLATLGFMVAQRHEYGIAERAVRRIARPWTNNGGAVEEASVHREILALHGRPGLLALAALLHFLGWLASGGEAWLALRFMGVPLPLASVFAIESLLYAIRSIAFAVPNAFGVQEGALVLLGAGFGLPPEVALALSLLKRGRDLVIGVPALLAWQALESRRAWRRPAALKAAAPAELGPKPR